MPQQMIAGPIAKGDLSHELGSDPMHTASVARGKGVGERRRPPLERGEPWSELFNDRLREASSDTAGIFQMMVVVEQTQQECAETVSRTARLGESADHELRTLERFDFEPIGAATAAIGGCAPFADDPFQPCPASLLKKRGASANDMLAQRSGPRSVGSLSRASAALRSSSGRLRRSAPSRYSTSKIM